MNITKINYFRNQLDIAVKNRMPEKADYYRRRISEIYKTSEANQVLPNTKFKGSSTEMLQKAIKIWNVKYHTAAAKHAFLVGKGIPEEIILQALTYMGNGKMLSDI